MLKDDRGRIPLQGGTFRPRKRAQRRYDIEPKAHIRSLLQRHEMGPRRVLNRQPTVQEFIGFQILRRRVRQCVIIFRKEARRAQHHAIQPGLKRELAAEPLGGQFRHAINIARCKRPVILVQPNGLRRCLVPDGLRNHQRCRGCHHEPVMPRRHGRLQQVQRARHIRIDKGLTRKPRNVRLVQGARMDDGFNAIIREYPVDQRPVGHRADHLCEGSRRHIQPDNAVPGCLKKRCKMAPQPAHRSGEQKFQRPAP